MLANPSSEIVFNKVKSCLIQGRFEEALESIVQAEISHSVGPNDVENLLLYKIEGYIGILQYKKALELAQTITKQKITLRNYSSIIQANLFEIECLRNMQYFDEAKIIVSRTENIFLKLSNTINTSNSELYAKFMFRKGHLFQSMGKLTDSINDYSKGLLIAQTINDRTFQQKILVNLASAYWEKNELDVSHKFCMQALAIKTTGESYLVISKCLNLMGLISQDRNNITSALNFYNQSLALKYKIGNRIEIAKTLHSIGYVNNLLEKYQESLNALEESYKIFQELENFTEMSILQNDIGQVYLKQGNSLQALKNFKTALSFSLKVKNDFLSAKNYSALSKIFLLKLDIKNALIYCEKSLEIRKKAQISIELGETYLQIGILHFIDKKPKIAMNFLTESNLIFKAIKNKIALTRAKMIQIILEENSKESKSISEQVSLISSLTENTDNPNVLLLRNLANAVILKSSIRLQDKGKAILIFREIAKNLKLDVYFIEYARLQELLLLFEEYQLFQNEQTLIDINNCITDLLSLADFNKQFLLKITLFRIKSKLALLLESIDNAITYMEEAFLFAQSNNLNDIIPKLQDEYESMDKKISYWNTFKKKRKISFADIEKIQIIELLQEIRDQNYIFYA